VNTITLTQEQQEVVDFAVERLKKCEPITTIGGYAGTGKTTIMGEIVKAVRESVPECRIAFACYTGKAKDVLERKLKASDALKEGDFCGTIHSLVYQPIKQEERRIDRETKKEHISVDVDFTKGHKDHSYNCLIVDEASMVDEYIFKDLSDLNIPMLFVGDHGQLPPVASRFNLMANPMRRLEKIHRQAEDNPIIRLSMLAREEGQIPYGECGSVLKTRDGSVVNRIPNLHEWMILCGTNKKRSRLNAFVREKRFGRMPERPQAGEKVICLQNNHARKIFNGMIGTVKSIQEADLHWYWAEIDMGDFLYVGKIFKHQFGHEKTCKETMRQCDEVHPDDFEDLFDYGYCLTTHKAQGSEAESVVVYEEHVMKRNGEEGWRRWLYTAITRARKNLVIIGE